MKKNEKIIQKKHFAAISNEQERAEKNQGVSFQRVFTQSR